MVGRSAFTATYSVVTPLFLGDALRDASRLSLASFKGQLRFWWRALAWPRIGDLAKLHEHEAELFGKAGEAGEKTLGQSRVLVRLEAQALGKPLPKNHRLGPGPGARYLGYGLMGAFGKNAGVLDRSCFPAGGRFRVRLMFAKDVDVSERKRVLDAAKLLGLLGGLGSRVRRGWGSLTLEKLHGPEVDWTKPQTVEAYGEAIRAIIGTPGNGTPPFSAFSAASRIDLLATGTEPLALLDRIGREMVRYRAWGFNGRILDGTEGRKEIFKNDHDWFKDVISGISRSDLPRRMAFGMPHNYFDRATRRSASVTVTDAAQKKFDAGDRRGSPLFLHIQDLGKGGFAAVATFLPATFTPDGDARAKWDGGGYTAPVATNWTGTITGWLEGDYRRNGTRVKFFPDRKALLP